MQIDIVGRLRSAGIPDSAIAELCGLSLDSLRTYVSAARTQHNIEIPSPLAASSQRGRVARALSELHEGMARNRALSADAAMVLIATAGTRSCMRAMAGRLQELGLLGTETLGALGWLLEAIDNPPRLRLRPPALAA